jgi:hypothetical protein
MGPRQRLVPLASLAVAVILAACAGPSAPTSLPSVSSAPAMASPAATFAGGPPLPSPVTSPAPGTTGQPTDQLPTFDPGGIHAFPALEARLPKTVTSHPMLVQSYGPSDNPDSQGVDAFGDALVASGRSAADLQMAAAVPQEDSLDVIIFAFAYPGATGADLAAILAEASGEGTIESSAIGGKAVQAISDAFGTSWAYASPDTLFVVGGDPALAEQALQALP